MNRRSLLAGTAAIIVNSALRGPYAAIAEPLPVPVPAPEMVPHPMHGGFLVPEDVARKLIAAWFDVTTEMLGPSFIAEPRHIIMREDETYTGPPIANGERFTITALPGKDRSLTKRRK